MRRKIRPPGASDLRIGHHLFRQSDLVLSRYRAFVSLVNERITSVVSTTTSGCSLSTTRRLRTRRDLSDMANGNERAHLLTADGTREIRFGDFRMARVADNGGSGRYSISSPRRLTGYIVRTLFPEWPPWSRDHNQMTFRIWMKNDHFPEPAGGKTKKWKHINYTWKAIFSKIKQVIFSDRIVRLVFSTASLKNLVFARSVQCTRLVKANKVAKAI